MTNSELREWEAIRCKLEMHRCRCFLKEWPRIMRACDFLKLYKERESELVLQDLATAKCLEEIRKVKEK